ncbi:hypothetical protein K439DRAFT_1619553 [Ramaria rubella]|nr:hypothetical protein K439DRAFT_1619553 [Ramaria rubella]
MHTNYRLPNRPLWASQFVTICGLESDTFRNGLKIVAALYQAFAARVGEANVQKFTVVQFAGYPSLNFARHYFSGIIDGTSEPLPKEIDPSGRLAKLGKDMHYNEENRVAYMKVNTYAGISSVAPSVIQTGALVEVMFTVTVKLQKNTWKWYQVRTLDDIVKLPPQICSISSKRGHDEVNDEDQEIGQTRKKLRELDISMVDEMQQSAEDHRC